MGDGKNDLRGLLGNEAAQKFDTEEHDKGHGRKDAEVLDYVIIGLMGFVGEVVAGDVSVNFHHLFVYFSGLSCVELPPRGAIVESLREKDRSDEVDFVPVGDDRVF